jgi:hypothetical protein
MRMRMRTRTPLKYAAGNSRGKARAYLHRSHHRRLPGEQRVQVQMRVAAVVVVVVHSRSCCVLAQESSSGSSLA